MRTERNKGAMARVELLLTIEGPGRNSDILKNPIARLMMIEGMTELKTEQRNTCLLRWLRVRHQI